MVYVHVEDADTGNPIGNAGVAFVHSLYGEIYGYTDDYGDLFLEVIPGSNWYLTVYKFGYTQYEKYVTVTSDTNLFNVSLVPAQQITYIVTAKVVNGFKIPLPQAYVTISRQAGGYSNAGYVNAQGEIVFGNVPFGVYDLTAAASGYDTARSTRTISQDVLITLQPYREYQLSVFSQPGGGTNYDGTQSIAEGVNVVITAYPQSGYYLENWIVNGQTIPAAGSSNLLISMDRDYYIEARFAAIPPGPYFLTLTKDGQGTLTPNQGYEIAPGVYQYQSPIEVTITASPEPRYWYEDGVLRQEKGLTFTTTMVKNKNVHAIFPGAADNKKLFIIGAAATAIIGLAATINKGK